MRPFPIVVAIAGLVATLAPAPVSAQTPGNPKLTTEELAAIAADLGAVLRFRQLGDTTTLPKGRVDVGVQFASAPIEDAAGAWNVTRFVARFGVSDRVDLGVWGGQNSGTNSGMAGMDVKIGLLRQSPDMPVSVSVRPSFSSLVGASDFWGGTTSVDLSVSRAFGALAAYGGVAATSSLAVERLADIDFENTSAGATVSYIGVSYTWRSLIAAAEIEHGTKASYAFRIGTRF
jgi:hypothetical protein